MAAVAGWLGETRLVPVGDFSWNWRGAPVLGLARPSGRPWMAMRSPERIKMGQVEK